MSGLPPTAPVNPNNANKRKVLNPAAPRKRSKKQEDAAGADGTAAGTGATPPKKPRQKKSTGSADGKSGGAKGKGKDKSADDDLELVEKEEGRVEDEPEEKLGKTHSGVFSKDLPWLMYGFGDADKPLKETVDLVEDIAVQFITDTVHAAMQSAAARNPGSSSSAAKKDEIRLEDLLFAVRRDPRKVARIQELIRRQQEIKDARKVLAGDEEGVEDLPDL